MSSGLPCDFRPPTGCKLYPSGVAGAMSAHGPKHVRGGDSRQAYRSRARPWGCGCPGNAGVPPAFLFTGASPPCAGGTPAFPGRAGPRRGIFLHVRAARSLDRKTVSRAIAARGVGPRPRPADEDCLAKGRAAPGGWRSRGRRSSAAGEDCPAGASTELLHAIGSRRLNGYGGLSVCRIVEREAGRLGFAPGGRARSRGLPAPAFGRVGRPTRQPFSPA